MHGGQKIAVKQLALHIDTWYISRGIGKEHATIATRVLWNTYPVY